MARISTTTITQSEVDAYAKFCVEHHIITDGSQDGIDNGNLVRNYFLKWGEDITEANLTLAFPQLKPHLKVFSPTQVEVNKIGETLEPVAAKKFLEWFKSQKFLVNEGEQGLQNAAELLKELQGREINQKTLADAIGRIEAPTSKFDTRVRRPLHYVKTERVVDPRSHVATDDGTPFLGNDLRKQADGSYGKSPADYARERVAASAKNNPTATDSVRLLEAQARQDAENIRGNSRYQDSLLSKTFVTRPGTSAIDWTATAAARRALLRSMVQAASRSVR